jgi:hypothetical protein
MQTMNCCSNPYESHMIARTDSDRLTPPVDIAGNFP